MKIFVNGYLVDTEESSLSYEDLIMAVSTVANSATRPSVTYLCGQVYGILSPGQRIALIEGMRFNVYDTGRA